MGAIVVIAWKLFFCSVIVLHLTARLRVTQHQNTFNNGSVSRLCPAINILSDVSYLCSSSLANFLGTMMCVSGTLFSDFGL